ncbi:MAG: hypothetical protein ACXVEE_26510 [Polyangiales bacterium]
MSNYTYDPYGFFVDPEPTTASVASSVSAAADDGRLWVGVDGSLAPTPAWRHVDGEIDVRDSPKDQDNSHLEADRAAEMQSEVQPTVPSEATSKEQNTKKYDPHGFFSDVAPSEASEWPGVVAPSSSAWVDIEGYAVTPRAFPPY